MVKHESSCPSVFVGAFLAQNVQHLTSLLLPTQFICVYPPPITRCLISRLRTGVQSRERRRDQKLVLEDTEAPEGRACWGGIPKLDGRRLSRPHRQYLSRHQPFTQASTEQMRTRGDGMGDQGEPFGRIGVLSRAEQLWLVMKLEQGLKLKQLSCIKKWQKML
ncbi:uncharacterized protein LOC127791096 [Diospyros lotus]|uniref:uncharacterized protein LOC127791096 n=1 Tax=Diospyros lotus TaxID=55363 RepID=UPI00224FD8D3|nr:uncharacterized protein LOC127791096 [Diospyros lotus]